MPYGVLSKIAGGKGTLMRDYRQLTEDDRIEIYAMKQAGKEQKQMAHILGVHPSTICEKLSALCRPKTEFRPL